MVTRCSQKQRSPTMSQPAAETMPLPEMAVMNEEHAQQQMVQWNIYKPSDADSQLSMHMETNPIQVNQTPITHGPRGFRWHSFAPGTDAVATEQGGGHLLQLPMPVSLESSQSLHQTLGVVEGELPLKKKAKTGDTSWKWCSFPGCAKYVVSKRLCIAHGGGRRCKIEGCEKSGQVSHCPQPPCHCSFHISADAAAHLSFLGKCRRGQPATLFFVVAVWERVEGPCLIWGLAFAGCLGSMQGAWWRAALHYRGL